MSGLFTRCAKAENAAPDVKRPIGVEFSYFVPSLQHEKPGRPSSVTLAPLGGRSIYAPLPIAGFTATGGSRGRQVAQYFNTSAVAQAVAGTYGTLGRNIPRGPGFNNTDLSVSRAFPLHFREGAKLAFRTEFFNLFNRPQLGLPNATIGNRTFGRITSSASAPRILQLSLKVEF